jgi:hypothetical protein
MASESPTEWIFLPFGTTFNRRTTKGKTLWCLSTLSIRLSIAFYWQSISTMSLEGGVQPMSWLSFRAE